MSKLLRWLAWWWDEASPWFYYSEKWAGPQWRPWWKFPVDYITWYWRYRR